jgi:hypothetical protein
MKTLLKIGAALGLAAAALMMAEIERAVQKTVAAGAEPVVFEGLSAADTQLILNKSGKVVIRVTNGAEAIIATIVTPNTVGGNPIEDLKNNIGANKVEIMGPFDPAVYNNAKGQLEVKFDKVTGVKLEIYEVDF